MTDLIRSNPIVYEVWGLNTTMDYAKAISMILAQAPKSEHKYTFDRDSGLGMMLVETEVEFDISGLVAAGYETEKRQEKPNPLI